MIATIPKEYCPILGSTQVCVTSVDPRFYTLVSTRDAFRNFFKKLLGNEISHTALDESCIVTGTLSIPVEEEVPPVEIAWAIERRDIANTRPSL